MSGEVSICLYFFSSAAQLINQCRKTVWVPEVKFGFTALLLIVIHMVAGPNVSLNQPVVDSFST